MSSKIPTFIPPHVTEEYSTEASPHLPGMSHSTSTSSIIAIPEDERLEEEENLDSFDHSTEGHSLPPPIPSRFTSGVGKEKFSPCPWTNYFDKEIKVAIPDTNDVFHLYTAGEEGPVVFCLHGGGYSGLSFALSAGLMKEKVRVVAMDMRGHGSTFTEDETDLSVERLSKDVIDVIQTMYGSDPPSIVLVGHSMGGAIAVRTAEMRLLLSLTGLVVVDVVEGSAMASLTHMQTILSGRPSTFPSLQAAIEWSVVMGSLRNIDSARVSVHSTLKRLDSGRYTWRTKLEDSEPYWKDWYDGLSETFLRCPVPKLLLLAGTDRLDRPLTIAQMQGKFQMLVIRHSGHAIQEDEPDEFAVAVLAFIQRNRIGARGVEIPGLRRLSS